MARPLHPASRDKLPTVVHGTGEETAAGPHSQTVPKADFIPTRLDHYKILHKLGQGGMGWVMLAEDTQLGRRVALKIMRSQHAAERESRERFMREAKSAAALKHDHIITIYQVGEDQGIPYLAMELLEGGTLQQRLEYPKPLSLGAAVRIAREIASGLGAAHERGVVHRDIKPANIWLESPKGRVKILDFGLARDADATAALTQAGEIIGTPHYMAPEQARAKGVDARCDLFSLGCIMYRMTTGRLPFAGDTLLATLTAIAVDMPPPVREINPQAPPALADLIWRLLAKDPAHRPASAADVIKELRAIEADLAGTKSGQNTDVLPLIQINTSSPSSIASAGKKSGLSGKHQPGKAPVSPLWTWIVAGAVVAALAAGLLWLISWALTTNGTAPRLQPSATLPEAVRPRTDLRQVIALDRPAGSACRDVAQWVLARGRLGSSRVEIRLANQQCVEITDAATLPEGDFTLAGLNLGPAPLADGDLDRFSELGTLSWLDLSGSPVTDDGLTKLAGLSALTRLNLENTRIGDATVAHIARVCPNLHCLVVSNTQCTPAALASIRGLKQLRELSLEAVPIAGEHLLELAGLSNLERLNLARTKVTGGGLLQLRGPVSLRCVEAAAGQFSPAEIAILRSVLPGCQVQMAADPLGGGAGTASL